MLTKKLLFFLISRPCYAQYFTVTTSFRTSRRRSGGTKPIDSDCPVSPYLCCLLFLHDSPSAEKAERQGKGASLKRGDKIVTIGGVHGTVAGIDTEKKTVLVQVSDSTKITFDRTAIANIDKQDSGDKLTTKE